VRLENRQMARPIVALADPLNDPGLAAPARADW